MYYTYMWSQVIAKDLFSEFEKIQSSFRLHIFASHLKPLIIFEFISPIMPIDFLFIIMDAHRPSSKEGCVAVFVSILI